MTGKEKQELLHNMLEVSMNTPLDKIDERLLNAWNLVKEILNKE